MSDQDYIIDQELWFFYESGKIPIRSTLHSIKDERYIMNVPYCIGTGKIISFAKEDLCLTREDLFKPKTKTHTINN